MFYITGDRHGDFYDINCFCKQTGTSRNDVLVVLGDSGINYYEDIRALNIKKSLTTLPITLFCIHGNHENRPENISSYATKQWNGGIVYFEKEFPNILFAKDGEIYNFDGKTVCVCGGAYSIDKQYRQLKGYNWWPDEQPSEQIKKRVEQNLKKQNWTVDYMFTHTCPVKYEPVEAFLPFVDQSTVDKSTEIWLDYIEDNLGYSIWYAGHYHIDTVKNNKICLLFREIVELGRTVRRR